MAIDGFKKLRVYQRGFQVAMDIFKISKGWPKAEQYSLTDQIRRSSCSVFSNIGEAWFKRRYPKHFVSKLSDAGSEAVETLVWLDFAVACEYMDESQAAQLGEQYEVILGGLVKMMNHPEQWCIPSSQVREDEADYDVEA